MKLLRIMAGAAVLISSAAIAAWHGPGFYVFVGDSRSDPPGAGDRIWSERYPGDQGSTAAFADCNRDAADLAKRLKPESKGRTIFYCAYQTFEIEGVGARDRHAIEAELNPK